MTDPTRQWLDEQDAIDRAHAEWRDLYDAKVATGEWQADEAEDSA